MTLITTVPARLALMLMDADEHIQFVGEGFQKNYESDTQLPAWEIADGGTNYDLVAANIANPVDTYTATLITQKYSAGMDDDTTRVNEYQTLTRSIMANTIEYFLKRPDLVFSDVRGVSTTGALPALVGVKWAKISREPEGIYGADEGFGRFWGGKLTFTVMTEIRVMRVLR